MKELFLIRGLPGSGKSTLAKSLGGVYREADMYFMSKTEWNLYEFNASKLKDAHEWCRSSVEGCMKDNITNPKLFTRIAVSNTFTQEWEMQPYYDLAQEYGYKVYCLIVENRHGGVNEHGVPQETLDKMKKRFEISL